MNLFITECISTMLYMFLTLTVYVILILAEEESRHPCLSTATPPDDIEKKYRDWLSADNGLHPSFQLIPNIFWQIGKMDKEALNTRNNTHVLSKLPGDRRCRKTMSITSGNINDRALCPWYFLLNYDETRYPEVLVTVKCKCKSCYSQVQEAGTGKSENLKQISSPRCQKIPYRQKVMKPLFVNNTTFCDDQGRYIYRPTYETIHIGCTCVVPKRDIKASHGKFVTQK